MRKLAIGGALILVIAAAAGYFYLRGGKGDPVEAYRTEAADRGDVTMTVTATGTISAVTTVQVGSQVSGIIAKLYADFNSPVTRGQLLAELDPTPFQARVEQRKADVLSAEVQLRRAALDFDRQKRLLEAQLSSQADFDGAQASFDAARAQVEQATAALRQAETDLEYTRIASPIDGVVVARQYDVGQTVAASFQAPTLFTIAQDLKKMQVQADVDQSDIGRVQVGQTARFTVDAYPEQDFRGEISQIRLNASVNQNVITYPVILAVPNPDEALRPQMTANVSIEVARVKDVLRIPNAALRFRPTQSAPGKEDGAAGRAGSRAEGPGGSANGRPTPEERAAKGGGGRRGGLAAAAAEFDRAAAAGKGGPAAGRPQTIYRLGPSGQPEKLAVRTGISDGRFTEIVGGELQPGDRIVVGQATARVQTTARPPGGGRMF